VIDMHAHWKPAEVAGGLRARIKEAPIVHDRDHVSILKFIEANWGLPPISGRSRDNLPNPVQSGANPYVPVNGPALSDLMSMFQRWPASLQETLEGASSWRLFLHRANDHHAHACRSQRIASQGIASPPIAARVHQ
jgi:hypothetical protein